jgi:guanylate kinase
VTVAAGAPESAGTPGAPTVPQGFRPRGLVVVVSGPSGVGKTSIYSRLLRERDDLEFSVSATTRPRRDGEVDGQDYWFLTEAEFRRRVAAGEFAEHAEVHGKSYGTLRAPVDDAVARGRIMLLDVDVQGGRSLRAGYPDGVFVFIYPPSLAVLEARLRGRASDRPEVIAERLRNAPGEMSHYAAYDYVVINDDLGRAQTTLGAIVAAERCRLSRLVPE